MSKTIRQLRRGETAYTQHWANSLNFSAEPRPSGTADRLIRRRLFGFDFVGQPKRATPWIFIVLLVVYLFLLIGGLVGMWITKSITGDAADPPIAFAMVLGWAVLTIIALGGALSAG